MMGWVYRSILLREKHLKEGQVLSPRELLGIIDALFLARREERLREFFEEHQGGDYRQSEPYRRISSASFMQGEDEEEILRLIAKEREGLYWFNRKEQFQNEEAVWRERTTYEVGVLRQCYARLQEDCEYLNFHPPPEIGFEVTQNPVMLATFPSLVGIRIVSLQEDAGHLYYELGKVVDQDKTVGDVSILTQAQSGKLGATSALVSADELFDLFNDEERARNYELRPQEVRYTDPNIPPLKIFSIEPKKRPQ